MLRHCRPRRDRLRGEAEIEGLIVNETCLSKSCGPAPAIPVAMGDVGEVVVTSFHPDYPMIRFATGDLFGGDQAARPADGPTCSNT